MTNNQVQEYLPADQPKNLESGDSRKGSETYVEAVAYGRDRNLEEHQVALERHLAQTLQMLVDLRSELGRVRLGRLPCLQQEIQHLRVQLEQAIQVHRQDRQSVSRLQARVTRLEKALSRVGFALDSSEVGDPLLDPLVEDEQALFDSQRSQEDPSDQELDPHDLVLRTALIHLHAQVGDPHDGSRLDPVDPPLHDRDQNWPDQFDDQ